jgi:dUTPase
MKEIPCFKFNILGDLDESFMPTQGSLYATGYDVKSSEDVDVHIGRYAKIPLGIKCIAPKGWWLELRPRSSTFTKLNLHCLYGVVDEDYEGQIFLAVQYIPPFRTESNGAYAVLGEGEEEVLKIKKGDRVGQIVPVKRHEVIFSHVTEEEFEVARNERAFDRGDGGFGSSGR